MELTVAWSTLSAIDTGSTSAGTKDLTTARGGLLLACLARVTLSMRYTTKRRRRTTEVRRGREHDKTPRVILRRYSLIHSKLHRELSPS